MRAFPSQTYFSFEKKTLAVTISELAITLPYLYMMMRGMNKYIH